MLEHLHQGFLFTWNPIFCPFAKEKTSSKPLFLTFRGVLNLSWAYFNSPHFRYKRIRLKISWISEAAITFHTPYSPCTLYLPTVIINLCQYVGKYSIHGASGYLSQSHKQPAPCRNHLAKWPRRSGQGDPFYDALQQAQVECRVVGWLEKTWEPPKPVNMVNATCFWCFEKLRFLNIPERS